MKYTFETVGGTRYLKLVFEGGEGLINYEAQMLINNDIKYFVKASKVQRNEDVQILYNVTGKTTLAEAVRKAKITRKELLKVIEGAIKAMADAKDYQLDADGFVFDEKYVFINQENYEPSFIFVPCRREKSGAEGLKELVSGLVLAGRVEATNDNFVQVLIDLINKPDLTVVDFKKLCDKYGAGERKVRNDYVKPERPPVTPKPEAVYTPPVPSKPAQPEAKQTEDKKSKKKAEKKPVPEINGKVILFVVLQAVLIGIIAAAAVSGILVDESGALNVQYLAGIEIGVLAADFIVYREMFVNNKDKEKEEKSGKEKKSKEKGKVKKTSVAIPGVAIPGKSEEKSERPATSLQKNANEDKVKTENKQPKVIIYDDEIEEPTEVDIGYDEGATEVMNGEGGEVYLEFYENGLATRIRLNRPNFLVGNLRTKCDFAIKNGKISRTHAEFITRDGKYYVKDCDSTNGTYINGGRRLPSYEEREIFNLDKITLADVDFTFHC